MQTIYAHKNSVAGDEYYQFTDDTGPLDFSSQFVKIEVAEKGKILSSEIDADGYAPVRMDGTKLYIDWGQFDLEPEIYTPTVYGYRAGDDKGEVIAGKGKGSHFILRLLPDDRASHT